MKFLSPEGREEVLWVEQQQHNTYRVLNVPVWIYGVSIGTVVEAERDRDDRLRFRAVVRESPGGTVRFIVPPGNRASQVYLQRVIPDAKRLGLHIGPATFFNPRLVAVNLYDRKEWWPRVGGYLETLVKGGVLEQWEVGDPDQYATDHEQDTLDSLGLSASPLVHPLPVDGVIGQDVS